MTVSRHLLIILLFVTGTRTFAQSGASKKFSNPTGFNRQQAFGTAIGVGTSRFKVTNSNWNQGTINYNDSLNSIVSKSGLKLDFTILYYVNFNKIFAFRPTITTSIGSEKIQYNKSQSFETVDAGTLSAIASLPMIFKFKSKKTQPFIMAGPSLSFMLGQDRKAKNILPLKTFDLLGDLGLGIDIDIPKWHAIASPEIRYSSGFFNRKAEGNNLYTNTIEQLKRRAFTFTIYMRGR